jgi:hypothetical protein
MIVLTDGKLPDEGKHYLDLVSSLRAKGITLSVILIGREGETFLRQLAELGGGSYYSTNDPRSLPQIFLQDVKVSTGERTMREESEFAVRQSASATELFAPERSYPPLLGFVENRERAQAKTELIVSGRDAAHPLLTWWDRGAGRVTAFTSDVSGRWSARWTRWRDFSAFVGELMQSVLAEDGPARNIDYDFSLLKDDGRDAVELYVYEQISLAHLENVLMGPDGKEYELQFRELAPGRFRATIPTTLPGKHTFWGNVGDLKLSPSAFYVDAEQFGEIQGQGFDETTLRALAERYSGTVNPKLDQLLHDRESFVVQKRINLSWIFLFLAVIFFIAHVLFRERSV